MRRLTLDLFRLSRPTFPLATQQHSSVSFARRCNSSQAAPHLTSRLQSDLRTALKSKDSFAATTIRVSALIDLILQYCSKLTDRTKSVLSEVYAAQKQSAPAALKSSEIISIIRRAKLRRLDSMKQFVSASRQDLAQQEQKEATLLASYLPAKLSSQEVDRILHQIIADTSDKENIKKAKGLALKTFYSQVDKNTVDGELVRKRLDELWTA